MTLGRLRVVLWIFCGLFALVEARLVHLQFGTRDFWTAEARKSRTGGAPVPFARGDILDRYGRPLAASETVHQLELVYGRFRRGTPIGLLVGASRMLMEAEGRSGGYPGVRDVLNDPGGWSEYVLSRSERVVAALPTQTEKDYTFYARRLLGLRETELRARRDARRDDSVRFVDYAESGLEFAVRGVREQALAIGELADAVLADREAFLDLVDEEIREVYAAIEDDLERRGSPPSRKQRLAAQRDHEARGRLLTRSAPYQAVYLVNLVPERFGGFIIEDVRQRLYPEDVRDLSPLLVGRVGYSTDDVLESARGDQLEYLELTSLTPQESDVAAAERISILRNRIRHEHYRPDEELGINGLEALLEPVLRGRRGWRLEERDGDRNVQRLIEMIDAVDGQHVRTTLDKDLQAACDRVLSAMVERGALVLIDPRDGAIRALATSPNPSRLQIRKEWAALSADERQPLHHRAYRPPGNPPPPGSVFKIVTAAAALEGGHATAGTRLRCDGTLSVGTTTLKCYQRRSHGEIDLVTALEKSCNIWFYKMSREVGLDALLAMAARFGYGTATGFGDPELLALPPGTRSLGEIPCPFQPGRGVTFTMRTAIGHGAIDDVTPLQVAAMMAMVANGDRRVRPYIVESIGGIPVHRAEPASLGLRRSTIDTLRRGMIAAVESGTARPVGEDDLRMWNLAVKTGTPQAVARGGREVDHAWMAGYFPHDAPRFAFALLIEENEVGGGGATRPVIAELLRQPEFVALLGAGLR